MLLNVQSNDELDRQNLENQAQAENDPAKKTEQTLSSLIQHILPLWEKAKRAKKPIYDLMLKNIRQRNGEYESDKLSAIKMIAGSEAFVMLTDTKCRSGEAWLKDVLFQPGQKPWDVEPTPIPELPPALEQQVTETYTQAAVSNMVNQSLAQGMPLDFMTMQQTMDQQMPDLKMLIGEALKAKAKENAKKVRDQIDDQLTQGGWYGALESCLEDVVDQKCAFLKGPIFRKEKIRKVTEGPDGVAQITYEDKIIPTFERRSPFSIYPSPESIGINDGYLFDHVNLSRRGLMSLIGVTGYKEEEVRLVLQEHADGSLASWLNLEGESERLAALGQSTEFMYEKRDKIDVLEFWGSINGKLLLEFGLTPTEIPDPDMDYDICAWIIGNHIIKAVLNYDPTGDKPFFKVSFVEDRDAFWGRCVPELIRDLQGICNAIVRAIVNNVGVGSGPQIEINEDRLPPGTSSVIWPLRVWRTTDAGMSTAPAMKVYNIPMNADKLVMVYNHFSKLADEQCGIPAYAHGDSNVGGGGNTASGLSMLMTQAARGIKSVIRSIDTSLIAPSIEHTFYWNVDQGAFTDILCDMNIVARGSSSLIAKEQQAMRLTEFLQVTNNPVDIQIIGLEGRKDLLVQSAKANEILIKGLEDRPALPPPLPGSQPPAIDPATGLPIEQSGMPGQLPGGPGPQQQTPGASPEKARLDAAGNKSKGEDQRLISHKAAPQQRATLS